MTRIKITPQFQAWIEEQKNQQNWSLAQLVSQGTIQEIPDFPDGKTIRRWLKGEVKFANESGVRALEQLFGVRYEAVEVQHQIRIETAASSINDKMKSPKVHWFFYAIGLVVSILIFVGSTFVFRAPPALAGFSGAVDPDSAWIEVNHFLDNQPAEIKCNANGLLRGIQFTREVTTSQRYRLPLVSGLTYVCVVRQKNSAARWSSSLYIETSEAPVPQVYIPGDGVGGELSHNPQIVFARHLSKETLDLPKVLIFPDQYLEVTDEGSLDLEGSFSLHLRFLKDAVLDGQTLLSKHFYAIDDDGSWTLLLNGGAHGSQLCFINFIESFSLRRQVCTSFLIQRDEWYTMSFTYDKDEKRYAWYLNGQYLDSGKQSFEIHNTNLNLTIGREAGNPGLSAFSGQMEEIRIYQEVLSEDRILLLHRNSEH